MKYNFLKIGTAVFLTFTGIAAAPSAQAVLAASYSAPLKRVAISGKNVNVWTSYSKNQIAFKAKNNSKWNVAATATDGQGNLWYKVGVNEWLEARNTIDLTANSVPAKVKKEKQAVVKASTKKQNLSQAPKPQVLTKPSTNTSQASNLNSVNIANVAAVPSSSSAAAVVALAKQQIGKPYVWGANSSASFDCSSLVQYVYQQAAGLSLPRVTTDQVKVGTTVPMSQLQPGDLLYWGAANAPYHVAIYVGNNQYVHAATPDQGVVQQTITPYYYPSLAKRVLQ
ncbi:C40 family peptidase [Lactobacillus sp. ESL0791]|uniref:C40 family peptidase n=1 Tax=Lactobacillus sp. ESL0791 TaxID=2983234 RepID=UPI0023F7DF69|nr:C40 family peptidase [Lactobacillus sp. ESL0791]MDF7639580.1 C40 family peptidase [Lactobacillus sp. ESL0791]